jgi:phosphatidylglycerophosphate synthase
MASLSGSLFTSLFYMLFIFTVLLLFVMSDMSYSLILSISIILAAHIMPSGQRGAGFLGGLTVCFKHPEPAKAELALPKETAPVQKRSYYIVNGITLWRVLMAPLVIFLAIHGDEGLFKWFLAISFLTDAIDGTLARRYHISSKRGARLDSIGDDLTILAAFIGMLVFHLDFVRQELTLLVLLAGFYLLQMTLALYSYGRMTAFHTVLAKAAAVLQAIFLLTLFFWPTAPKVLFYTASALTALDLAEEIVLILLLREWKTDVKGLYWILKSRSGHPGAGK